MLRDILETSKRILIPRLDTHGDIVLLQGFISRLLTSYPHVELTLLVREGYDQLKPLLPDRIRWMITPANGYGPLEGKNIEETDILLGQLRTGEWDTVLTTTYNRTWLNHTVSAQLAGAMRIAIGDPEEIELGIHDFWRERNIPVQYPYDELVPVDKWSHETEKYQILWEFITGKSEKLPPPSLRVPEEMLVTADGMLFTLDLQDKAYCICCPAGTDNVQIKAWSEKKFADVLCWLEKEQGIVSLVVGGERERERLEKVVSLIQERGCSSSLWVGKDGELPLAAALIKKARLYFGNDTGLMHMASALSVPVVAIFGGGTWPRFLPSGKSVILVKELPCFGCEWKCFFGNAPCMKLISIEDVKMGFSLLCRGTDESFRLIRQAELSSESVVEELVRSAKQQRDRIVEERDKAAQEIRKRDGLLADLRSDRDTAVQEIHRRDGLITVLKSDRDAAVEGIHKRDGLITDLKSDRDAAVEGIHKRDSLISDLRNDRDTAVQEIHKRDGLITDLKSDRDAAVEGIHKRDGLIADLRNDRDTAVQQVLTRDVRIARLEEIKEQSFRIVPLVSIITPVFNAEKWVEKCIVSVMNQDYPRIEHIIVDGGSRDRTLDICRNYPHLITHSQPDRGQSHAINKGFAMAQGEILAWLCADDEYEPGAVAAAVRKILSGCEVTVGYSRFIDAEGNFIAEHPANAHPYYDHGMFLRFWKYNPISQPATFWTRRMWETYGPLRENLYFAMDYDLWLRMSQKTRFERIEAHVAKYRIHPEAKCFADNYGSRIELIKVGRHYWPSRWNPRHWILFLQYMFTWGPITKHYAEAEKLLNTAMEHLARTERFRALASFVMAHLRHLATPLMPGYPLVVQRILVEGIGPRWFWRFVRRAYGTLIREKRVNLRLTDVSPEEGAAILLEADSIGYRHPQFRFWRKRGKDFILLRDWGPANTYGPVNLMEGASDYGVHLRAGDEGDFIDQAWVKSL